jgi:hypothetical protein
MAGLGFESFKPGFCRATVLPPTSQIPLVKKTQFNPMTELDLLNRTARQLMKRYCKAIIAFGLIGGCATAARTPLEADNPANPSAPEASVRLPHNALAVDDLTRKTRQILAKSAEQQQTDQSGPPSSDQRGQQLQIMPDMKMPQE